MAPYTPENNPYIKGDPYSYDLKWMVDQIKGWKDPADSADHAKASEEAAALSAEAADLSAQAADDSAEAAKNSEEAAADYAEHIADPVSGLVTTWLDDHITQPTTPAIDTSLTVAGAAADAKAAGDAISNLNNAFNEVVFNGSLGLSTAIDAWEIGSIDGNTGMAIANSKRLRTANFVKVQEGEKLIFSISSGYVYEVVYYDSASAENFDGIVVPWTSDETILEPNHPYIKIIIADSTYNQDASLTWGTYLSAIYTTAISELKEEVDGINAAIIKESDNLLDPSTFTTNTSNTVISEFIAVDGGSNYGFLIYPAYWELKTYDDTKTLLSTITVTASTYASNQIQLLDSSVAYIRLVVLTANRDYEMCIRKGNTVPTYVPYSGYKYSFINSDYVKKSEINYDFSSYGLAYIQNNRLKANVWTNQAQTAVYSCIDAGSESHKMTCKAYWSNDDTNSTIAIISTKRHNKNVTDILVKSLHPVFTRTGAKVDFLDNDAFTNIYNETYDTPLTSGVEYEFGWEVTSADTIVIKTATGNHTVTMSGYNFTDYIGQYCILEHYNGNGASQSGMPWFTEWIAYDSGSNVIVFDLYEKPDSVLQTTLNGLPYYQFSNHTGWRVTN